VWVYVLADRHSRRLERTSHRLHPGLACGSRTWRRTLQTHLTSSSAMIVLLLMSTTSAPARP
jgi:hypothetical protein